MSIRCHRLTDLMPLCALILGPFTCAAQDTIPAPPDNAKEKSPQEIRSEEVAASAEQFQLFISAEADEPLEMKQVFQWADPVLPEGRSLCLLYFHQGRPVGSCKVYRTRRKIVHTFISMSNHTLEARLNGEIVWTPPESGLEFQQLVTARPDENPARRRIQMKSIAREFSAITGDAEAKRQQGVNELRLLPTPLYRYPADLKSDDGVFDGAVFAFVVGGGNPQFFLILEAVREDKHTHWRYAFSRRTLAKLEAFHKGDPVWDVEFFPRDRMTPMASFCKIDLPVEER